MLKSSFVTWDGCGVGRGAEGACKCVRVCVMCVRVCVSVRAHMRVCMCASALRQNQGAHCPKVRNIRQNQGVNVQTCENMNVQ